MNKTRIILWIILSISLLCVGCTGENTAGLQSENGSAQNTDAGIAESANSEKTGAQGEEESAYEVEIEEYGFTLPKLDDFRIELENLIYWTYATAPTKEYPNIYSYLKEKQVLGKSLKVKLSYVKSAINRFGETDDEGRPHYQIYISFPDMQEKEEYMWLCSYNAKGIGDVYEFDAEESYSKQELQEEGEELGGCVDWGETTICIDEEKAEKFVPEEDTSEIRKKIENDCLKEIRDYGEVGECEIYLYDFLPGEEWLHGQILFCNPGKGGYPYAYFTVQILYDGEKMEDYSEIIWHQSSHGPQPDEMTAEDARKISEEYKKEMLPEHCFLAYHIKGDEITSLKQE